MIILLGDDGTALVCETVPSAYVIMWGCMSEEQTVNVVPSVRLPLINGQFTSRFPFTPLC